MKLQVISENLILYDTSADNIQFSLTYVLLFAMLPLNILEMYVLFLLRKKERKTYAGLEKAVHRTTSVM